jgi:hypothetical protein
METGNKRPPCSPLCWNGIENEQGKFDFKSSITISFFYQTKPPSGLIKIIIKESKQKKAFYLGEKNTTILERKKRKIRASVKEQ